jgi:hypothetical protein
MIAEQPFCLTCWTQIFSCEQIYCCIFIVFVWCLQISIQRCDMDGDNRLRVCQSACQSYNKACGARLDCSDRTLFSGEEGYGSGTCTGDGTTEAWLQLHLRTLLLAGLLIAITGFFLATIRYICQTLQTSGSGVMGDSMHDLHGPYVVITEGEFEGGLSGTGRRKPLGTFCSLPMEPLLSLFMHKTSRLPSRHLLSDILLMHTRQNQELCSLQYCTWMPAHLPAVSFVFALLASPCLLACLFGAFVDYPLLPRYHLLRNSRFTRVLQSELQKIFFSCPSFR